MSQPAARTARSRLACNLLVAMGVAAGGCGEPVMDRKVLVIGIDGIRVDVLHEVDTPNLDALAASGTFSDRATTTQPTVSGPAWSSLLTGVWPQKHGVTSNDLRGHRFADYPDFITRAEQLRPELNTFVAADWLPLVADDAGGPVIGNAPDEKFVVDGYAIGWAAADSQVVAVAVRQLREHDPDVLFVYLGNPDEASHAAGSIGEEYRAAIVAADRHIGELREAVRMRPRRDREDWLVLVSTDHGRRADGGHGGRSPEESTIFFIAAAAARAGAPDAVPAVVDAAVPAVVDVAVTALAHLGFTIDPAWSLDGRPVGPAMPVPPRAREP